jgi:hypothetical protein
VVICRHSISVFLSFFFIMSYYSFRSCCQALVTSLMLQYFCQPIGFSLPSFLQLFPARPLLLAILPTLLQYKQNCLCCVRKNVSSFLLIARQWKYISLKKSMHLKSSPLKSEILREALSFLYWNKWSLLYLEGKVQLKHFCKNQSKNSSCLPRLPMAHPLFRLGNRLCKSRETSPRFPCRFKNGGSERRNTEMLSWRRFKYIMYWGAVS